MSRVALSVAGCLIFAVVGCGGDALPKRVPVTGSVLYKEKPVVGATVSFQGEGAPRVASGITNAEGKFSLTTYEPNDGAVVGNHTITVVKLDTSNVVKEEMSADNPGEAYSRAMTNATVNVKMGAKDELPTIYGDPARTPLKETVTEAGPNIFTLQLK